jgi:hypothetical protein
MADSRIPIFVLSAELIGLRSLVVWAIKTHQKYIPRNDTDPPGIDYLVRIFKAYELVTTSTTVRSSWAKTGFEYCKRVLIAH